MKEVLDTLGSHLCGLYLGGGEEDDGAEDDEGELEDLGASEHLLLLMIIVMPSNL